MDCAQYAENMTAYLDGELCAADAEQMRLHLSSCAFCAGELGSLQEAADFIESHRKELEPRLESWNLVRARISQADSFSRFRSVRWRVALAALAIPAAFALGYLQYHQIQRTALDTFISEYQREREARGQERSILVNKIEIPYANNPFIEVKANVVDNPFRSEDR